MKKTCLACLIIPITPQCRHVTSSLYVIIAIMVKAMVHTGIYWGKTVR